MNQSNSRSHLWEGLKRLLSQSVILAFLYRLCCLIYQKARQSAIGTFLCAYDENNGLIKNSFAAHIFSRISVKQKILRPLKFFFAEAFGNSLICNKIRSGILSFTRISSSQIGLSLLFFSLSALTMEGISAIRAGLDAMSGTNLIVSLVILISSFTLLGTRQPIGICVLRSRFLGPILFDILDIDGNYINDETPVKAYPVVSIVIGTVWGLLSFFVPLLYLVVLPFALLALYLILCLPETGVVLSLFAAPFLPTMVMVAIISYAFLCYFIKLIAGRRIMRFEPLDYAVVLFLFLYILGSFTSIDFSLSVLPTLVFTCFILGYFLVVNLIRDEKWFRRALTALTLSASFEALYGIYQNYFSKADNTWQDTEMFDDIAGRVVSTLENPNVLGEYLILCLPLLFLSIWIGNGTQEKLRRCIPFVLCSTCLIFTWSRGAWLGFIFSMIVLLLMLSRKSLMLCFAGVAAVPFLPFVLPPNILHRFTSIGNLKDSSTSYRVSIWRGTLRMLKDHFFSGIGSGIDLFPLVYRDYSLIGIEKAPHSHNLYLQLLVEMGIWGLLAFLLIVLFCAKTTFHTVNRDKMDRNRLISAGLFCGILAVLIQGMTDYIWYNYRMFLIFWLFVGLLSAAGKIASKKTSVLDTLM